MHLNVDIALLRLCKAADHIDRHADAISASVADLPLDDPRTIAAFAVIDPLMRSWHELRLVVAALPAQTVRAKYARAALLGSDEIAGEAFSSEQMPAVAACALRAWASEQGDQVGCGCADGLQAEQAAMSRARQPVLISPC